MRLVLKNNEDNLLFYLDYYNLGVKTSKVKQIAKKYKADEPIKDWKQEDKNEIKTVIDASLSYFNDADNSIKSFISILSSLPNNIDFRTPEYNNFIKEVQKYIESRRRSLNSIKSKF